MNTKYLMENTCNFNCNWNNGCCHRIKLEDIHLTILNINFLKIWEKPAILSKNL